MAPALPVTSVVAVRHTISFHLQYPYLFVFGLDKRDVELWVHDDAVAQFLRRGSFQVFNHNDSSYYNANRAILVIDEDRGFFAILDYNRVPPYLEDDVVWHILKIFSLEDARFLRTIDLRGLLVPSNFIYCSGRLVGLLYSLTADGTNIETSAHRAVSILLADTTGSGNLDRTSELSACIVLEVGHDPDTRYPQPVVSMPSGDVICVTRGWLEPEGRRLGLARWNQADLANGRAPHHYSTIKLDCNPGADHSSNLAWKLPPGAELDSSDEWAVPLGTDALVVCMSTRWTAEIVDDAFWASSRLQAFDALGNAFVLRWSADILRGVAQIARYVPSLDAVVVLGEHDFAGHQEDGTISDDEGGESGGHGVTSWIAMLNPRTGETRKTQAFAHRAENLALAVSGFGARADGGLDIVFVFNNGAIYVVAAEEFATRGFPRTEDGGLSVRPAFEVKEGWEIRGAAVGDGCAVVLTANSKWGSESSASDVQYVVW
jgi:hypothetical protein